MCPSVWLTLDILAGRQKPNTGAAGVSQYVGSWLDKLKANREVDGRANRGDDEYSSNVHFALEYNSTTTTHGGGATTAELSVLEREVDVGERREISGESAGDVQNKRRRKKKRKKVIGLAKKGASKDSQEILVMMEDLKPIVDCSFDLPKSQVGSQRLMGTNVVRLTDKSFMQELRHRIKEDYNAILQKRIAAREAKEIERERTLAISSRTGCIPQTLAGKPVNLIGKASQEMNRSRAKLKTNREKNAERLIRQSIKWERERLISYEMEKKRVLEAQKRREEELMVDRSDFGQYLNLSSARRNKDRDANLLKTQIEDSPATDNKLESVEIRNNGTKENKETLDEDTDEGESEELVHDDQNGDGDQSEENKTGLSSQDSSGQLESIDEVESPAEDAKQKSESRSLNKTAQPKNPVNAIIVTDDDIMNRLMAAETVEELYRIAEDIIGKTKVKRIKHLLST